jgi:hypothetical protein
MDILELLTRDEEAIVAEALTAVSWLEHYGRDGEAVTRERLRAGYDRAEVAGAFSAVEEAIWHRAFLAMPSADRAWALGLVGTALSHARQALARAFAEAGTGGIPTHVDMSPIFRGAERR